MDGDARELNRLAGESVVGVPEELDPAVGNAGVAPRPDRLGAQETSVKEVEAAVPAVTALPYSHRVRGLAPGAVEEKSIRAEVDDPWGAMRGTQVRLPSQTCETSEVDSEHSLPARVGRLLPAPLASRRAANRCTGLPGFGEDDARPASSHGPLPHPHRIRQFELAAWLDRGIAGGIQLAARHSARPIVRRLGHRWQLRIS